MTRLTIAQNSFASGEIDPRLTGQTEIKAYEQGVKRARDVARLASGGYERRPGSYDLAALAGRARLAEFEFSDTQRYVVAFSAATVEIFDINGVPLQTIVGCPWDSAQVDELTYSQLGDTMVITHIAWATRKLVRLSATTFALSLFAFDRSSNDEKIYQPYYKFAAAAVTISPSGTTGSITLTASAALFVAGHIGTRFRINEVEVEITAVASALSATGTVKGTLKTKLALDPFKTKSGTLTVEVQHAFHGFATGASVTISGSNVTGGLTSAQLDGTYSITVIDEHNYKFTTTGGNATASEDGGGSNVEVTASGQTTRSWTEPSISAVRGYPGASCFHEGRLYLAATPSQPDGVWGSSALAYFNFDVGTGLDGDSVQGAAGTEDISRIRHLVSNGELQLFTPMREMVYITRDGDAITPLNQRIKSQSNTGIGNVQPIVFDDATLFVQENGRSVSEITYSNEKGGYVPVPISTLASHLIVDPVAAAASQGLTSRAEQYAFFVNSDGTVAIFHSLRSENLAGWGLWTLGAGDVRSVCGIGPYVFFSVEVRGAHRLYRLATDSIVSLDGAVLHTSGVETVDWVLDARLRGRDVHLVSEKGYHGEVAVPSDGVVTLDIPVSSLVGGDAFYFVIETLPPAPVLPSGQRARFVKRILRTMLELYEASAVTVDGKRIQSLNAGDDFEAGVTPMTGVYEVRHLGFARSPTIVISQAEPLPASLLALTQEVKV